MNSIVSETITSLDMNFSNGSGGHSASIVTVLNAKEVSGSLGSLIALGGDKIKFSDSKLNKLFQNFIEIEKTIQRDGTKTVIVRKCVDKTSLLLRSHCVVVRGKDVDPLDKDRYTRILPYFGEVKNSGIKKGGEADFIYLNPKVSGGIIRLGQVYNEESSSSSSGDKFSLVYKQQKLQKKLSYNGSLVSDYYENNPDLSRYNLLFGYTLNELVKALSNIGITVNGLPKRGQASGDSILFSTSGNLDAILSEVAAKLGYYWCINPISGQIEFINSTTASQLTIEDPTKAKLSDLEKYINASYTENYLKPVIVNAFSSTIEKHEQTFESGDSERFTRFRLCKTLDKLDGKLDKSLFKYFYGAFCASSLTTDVFDALCFYDLMKDKKIKWGDNYESKPELSDQDEKKFSDIYASAKSREKEKEKLNTDFNLDTAKFIQLDRQSKKQPIKPSSLPIFSVLTQVFENLGNTIYISDKFSHWKARRMNFASSNMSISGPYKLDTPINEIDSLASISALIKSISDTDITLRELSEWAGSKGLNDDPYVFVGICPLNTKIFDKAKLKTDDYKLINEENFIYYESIATKHYYVGYSQRLWGKIQGLLSNSESLFKEMIKTSSSKAANTMKAKFTRSKRPTSDIDGEKSRDREERESTTQSGLDAIAQKLAELRERFDVRYYNLKRNGATGDPLMPVTLDLKQGKILEIQALEQNSYVNKSNQQKTLKSSSTTIAGLELPSFTSPNDVFTLSSLSIQLNSSGVTTTINRSTLRLLPEDEQLMIDAGLKANLSRTISSKLAAAARNALKL